MAFHRNDRLMLRFRRPISVRKLGLGVQSWEVKIHLTITTIITASLLFEEPRTTLILGGILCFPTYLYLAFREARRAPLWLSPLSFYFFWYSIGMGISPLYVAVMTQGSSIRFASPGSMVTWNELAIGYVVFLIGSLALHFGIQLFRPRAEIEPQPSFRPGLLKWFVAVWVAGVVFQLSPASFSFLGATAKIFSVAVVGSLCGFAITPRQRFGLSRSAFVLLLVVGTAGLFFGNLASGSKAYIMFSFLPLFWFFIIRPRWRLWIPLPALSLGIFYLALVSPVVYTARQSTIEEGQNPREHLIETFETWRKERPQELNETFLAVQLDQFITRQFDAVAVGFIVGEVERWGLLFGETMQYASYAFVPRLLWPDKPTVTRGTWFSTYLGAFRDEAEATTSIGMTAIGELYWNFGLAGVLVGMLAIGCFQGLLWRMAGADPRGKPLHMLLYVSLMLSMPDMPEAVTVFASLAVLFLTFKAVFLAQKMLDRRRKKLQLLVAYSENASLQQRQQLRSLQG